MGNTDLDGWVPRTAPPTALEIMGIQHRPSGRKVTVHSEAADVRARALEILRAHHGLMTMAEAVKRAQSEVDIDSK